MKKKTKKKSAPKTRHTIKTRKIELPDWAYACRLQDKHALPNLIKWCEEQGNARHAVIAAWLTATCDMMGLMTKAAFAKSQIDSRKKTR